MARAAKAEPTTGPRRTEYMPIDEMLEATNNPKGHDGARIRGAIERYGFVDQAILDERTGRLIAGHGRLEQLREMRDAGDSPPEGIAVDADGRWCWPVTRGWRSRSDVEAATINVTLNRLTELGGWDDIAGLTKILDDANAVDPALLDLAGYTPDELDTLKALAEHQQSAGSDADDDALLAATDREAWPRISVQVPPDVYDRWRAVPGDDDGDRVVAVLGVWEQEHPYRPGAAADDDGDGDGDE